MIVLSALFFKLPLLYSVDARNVIPSDCTDLWHSDKEACAKPIPDVVPITPNSFYAAKIRCYDCPYYGWVDKGEDREYMLQSGDYDLLFNITLSPDNRTVLLNNYPFFPTLRTIPTPPAIYVPQLRPEFSYENLSYALACRNPACRAEDGRTQVEDSCLEWCHELQINKIPIDYLYITRSVDYHGDTTEDDAEYWEFGLDAIGAYDGYLKDPKWGFDNPSQKMLKVLVAGTEANRKHYKGEKDMQAASSLFGPFGEAEKVYNYRIVEVELVDREFKFPKQTSLSLREKISRFFGNDIWQPEGRFVYISDEWGRYGKNGTLRDMFGELIHWYLWEMVWIIVGSVVGGLLVLFGLYKLYFWIVQQRELMKWNGIDDVWDKLRREREEEENALLDGRYRDEPDEGGSSTAHRYTDDFDTMKPLPTKPLPEKPLPDIPLIDA